MTDDIPAGLPPRTDGPRHRRAVTVVTGMAAFVVLALAVGSCSGSGAGRASRSDRSLTSGGSSGAREKSSVAARAGGTNTRGRPLAGDMAQSDATLTGQAAPTGAQASTPAVGPKIVKTGSLDVEVRRNGFSDAVARLTSVVTGMNGFVAQSQTSESGDAPSGTVTLRVPVDRFEALVVQARELGRVRSATTGGQDVTGEYTDVVSRLKTFTGERDQLLLVLGGAKGIPDILSVRDRLNSVQAEIEQLQGRRNVLDDQTSLSTLTVSLHEAASGRPGPNHRSGLSAAWSRAVSRFVGGMEAIVAGSGTVALLALCALVLWLVGRPVWRRLSPTDS